jgi:valyl-tRNA synthetase
LIKNNEDTYQSTLSYIQKLSTINELKVVSDAKDFSVNAVALTFNDIVINLPLDSMVDANAEKERIEKETPDYSGAFCVLILNFLDIA